VGVAHARVVVGRVHAELERAGVAAVRHPGAHGSSSPRDADEGAAVDRQVVDDARLRARAPRGRARLAHTPRGPGRSRCRACARARRTQRYLLHQRTEPGHAAGGAAPPAARGGARPQDRRPAPQWARRRAGSGGRPAWARARGAARRARARPPSAPALRWGRAHAAHRRLGGRRMPLPGGCVRPRCRRCSPSRASQRRGLPPLLHRACASSSRAG
jgi:hypothetical protein